MIDVIIQPPMTSHRRFIRLPTDIVDASGLANMPVCLGEGGPVGRVLSAAVRGGFLEANIEFDAPPSFAADLDAEYIAAAAGRMVPMSVGYDGGPEFEDAREEWYDAWNWARETGGGDPVGPGMEQFAHDRFAEREAVDPLTRKPERGSPRTRM